MEEYKKALARSTSDNLDPLVNYLNKQKDFIEVNRDMFYLITKKYYFKSSNDTDLKAYLKGHIKQQYKWKNRI